MPYSNMCCDHIEDNGSKLFFPNWFAASSSGVMSDSNLFWNAYNWVSLLSNIGLEFDRTTVYNNPKPRHFVAIESDVDM